VYPFNKQLENEANFRRFYSAYIKASDSNSCLHLHRQLSNRDLIRRLAQFDLGFFHPSLLGPDLVNTPDKLRYCASNKIFDYIEAGLPVVLYDSFHQRGLVRHYGAIIEVESFGELLSAIASFRSGENNKCAKSATISHHAPRLVRRYSEVGIDGNRKPRAK
jgi:hypothetical protein